ncbi:MAG: hypothetical protein KBI01_04200 [Oscillospiraceae bacterium]|nr:hypothetical protein [Oscillospiraceae bacterium]
MKHKKAQLAGFVFTVLLGTVLHFTFELSGENPIVGLFSAVNESVWEHLKLLYVPMLIFGIFEYFRYGKKLENFIPVRFLSMLLGMAVIVVGFYTYTGIIGENYLIIDILLFILAVYAAYRFSNEMLGTHKFTSSCAKGLAIMGLIFLTACFAVFTFAPPNIPLFLDPISGKYGISE